MNSDRTLKMLIVNAISVLVGVGVIALAFRIAGPEQGWLLNSTAFVLCGVGFVLTVPSFVELSEAWTQRRLRLIRERNGDRFEPL